jgi:hypothetical protein
MNRINPAADAFRKFHLQSMRRGKAGAHLFCAPKDNDQAVEPTTKHPDCIFRSRG